MPSDPDIPRRSDQALVATLRGIVGRRHVLTSVSATRGYRTGYRTQPGEALAVVRPGSLVEQWRVVQACVAADVILILQAANTGLTGGSTPQGAYDRPVVILSTRRLKGVHLLDGGRQVVCLPGATLYELERLLKPLGREPHSVIGSSCIGASVIGGVCNNSGGALVRRGPAFTQLALYARLEADGALRLVNHLGIALAGDAEAILARVEQGDFPAVDHDPARAASDAHYASRVRDVDADTPARFNADPNGLFEASGSAGRLVLFAVRLDTFPRDDATATFYIGANDAQALGRLRRDILSGFEALPVAGEYIHREAFDVAALYGKDMFVAIQRLGTDRLPLLFAMKNRIDALLRRPGLSDRLLQRAASLLPGHLPPRMREWRDRYEHHLLLKMAGPGIDEARSYLSQRLPAGSGWFECTPDEATAAFLHRFAVAGAAVRYREIHRDRVEDILALDIALPRNDRDWFERLPPEIDRQIVARLYYGHFFCHVFHQDYVVAKGADPQALKDRMLALLDARGAEYPAEHNVGHQYAAKPALADHYRALDPTNRLNPGIGKTSRAKHWA
ncbi:D-lactate dehydrogenase [Sphingomonas soli]|uniref:D-lactate dehydrogenase n=1 Tax=Sphingomonas soli TaxID=266127 RepID=UPI00082CAE3F|nr:D-lactate dehydrogenase [Sphingomonas soli]